MHRMNSALPASLTTVPYSQTGICVSEDYSQRKYTCFTVHAENMQ